MWEMSWRTLAPVVVKPDMASKKALDSDSGWRHSMNGTMPKREKTTHTMAVSRKPSRLPME